MSIGIQTPAGLEWPDHTQLPDSDGKPVENPLELPQAALLNDLFRPVLLKIQPDGQFAIGGNSGIYWRVTEPPLDGCKAPDWYCVLGVPPHEVNGVQRRSYVLWKEIISPLILLEFVSGDGSEEHDATPWQGKFWVYERAIRPGFYGIFDEERGTLEMYHLLESRFVRMEPNARGHYEIPELDVEIGIWHGDYAGKETGWLRLWDEIGNLIATSDERSNIEGRRANREKARADTEKARADTEKARAERLAAKLRDLGVDPDSI